MNQMNKKPRVFISHSSQDKHFVEQLVWDLRRFDFEVWYDDWEIAIGDSIVEKVFAGLAASDALLIVLSSASVASRWVKEELDVAVMRRLSENDIRILPVLAETCDIPTPLKHIRYADFRDDHQDALSRLLDSLAPGHLMWQSLEHAYDHFCILCDEIGKSDLEAESGDKLLRIHSLLESALNLRTEIEFRRARQKMRDLTFFEKIGVLAEKGVDVRSQTWNALVHYRACVAHKMGSHRAHLHMLANMLKERYKTDDIRESITSAMERLKRVMHMLCFESWDYDNPGRSKKPRGT